jgi:hypothetical protein
MRTWVLPAWILPAGLLASSAARADDGTLRMRRAGEVQTEPLLHLDATTPMPEDAEGGIVDRHGGLFDLGPGARLSAEGKWWQTGLAPSMFSDDLHTNGWRASAELSYDLGLFRVGVNASMARIRDSSQRDSTHRMVGLFAYRTFRLSHWMQAWIVLGIAVEHWDGTGQPGTKQGVNMGLALGTTFR